MKTATYLSLLLLVIISSSSCKQNNQSNSGNPVTGDYLIIGNVGGFINKPTTNFYRISNSSLTEDTSVRYGYPPTDVSQLNFNITLPASKYDSVKSLLTSIPSDLLAKNNTHIGGIFPDMGYTDVWASINGVSYKWYFEGDQSASSPAIQQFVNSLQVVFR